MTYFTEYASELVGPLTLASDGAHLVGCWFEGDRFFGYGVSGETARRDDLPVFAQARSWLYRYFAGGRPAPAELPLQPNGSAFQLRVWQHIARIPYGGTATYGEIARMLEGETGRRQSAQAVGGAVGRNPLCVIVPCHRVMGAHGNLTGFGGGIDRKIALLEHEGIDTSGFRRP